MENTENLDLEKAKELIENKKKEIDEQCQNEINEILKKFNRALYINGQFSGERIVYNISLIETPVN